MNLKLHKSPALHTLVIVLVVTLVTAVGSNSLAGTLDDFKMRDTVFANGLTVVAMEDKSDPLIAIWIEYDAGSRMNPEGQSGISVVAMHVYNNGSLGYREGEYERLIHSGGGKVISQSWQDATFFASKFPVGMLRDVLLVEADRMENPQLSLESLQEAKNSAIRENEEYNSSSPYAPLVQELFSQMFTVHPYGNSPVGDPDQITSLTESDVRNWMSQYFTPANATLAIVGDFKNKDALALVAEIFGVIPSPPKPTTTLTPEPEQTAERTAQLQSTVEIPVFLLGYHTPSVSDSDAVAMELLANILAMDRSSRLYSTLVSRTGLCFYAGGGYVQTDDPGMLYMYAFSNQGEDIGEALDSSLAEIESVKNGNLTLGDLIIARNKLESSTYRNLAGALNRAGALASSKRTTGDALRSSKAMQKASLLTTTELTRVAQKYLKSSNRTVVRLVQHGGDTTQTREDNQ